jgi:hypothetical protein
MRANGVFDCHATPKPITYMELYVSLKRYRDGVWTTLNTNRWERFSAGTLQGQAQYDCHHQSQYLYRSETFAYDVAGASDTLAAPMPTALRSAGPSGHPRMTCGRPACARGGDSPLPARRWGTRG